MYSNFLQIILVAQLAYLITCQEGEKESQVMVRDKRQAYTVYYLCGSPPNNYLSKTHPTCEGREVSNGYCQNGRCNSGYFCRSGGVCCRCEFGTSIGPCVNGQCPNNTFCNRNDECCPFQVGK
ncbi:hypothetical protein WR25_07039 [Diploscapter pachys]|uniref:CC domain-containing protein n=1 Tax=Diploscapter pachys TaxID=2018661 RepID=A0A2A2JSA6_9BILA|nr:hypothetical protein WR25_07039 [Diploscapter pachys]